MKLKPIGKRIVVEFIEEENENELGIVLPDSAKEEPQYAYVRAVSDEIVNDDEVKNLLKEGDKVVFAKYSGTEIELGDNKYTIVKLSDVQAVIED